jgi:hypothetical protein
VDDQGNRFVSGPQETFLVSSISWAVTLEE